MLSAVPLLLIFGIASLLSVSLLILYALSRNEKVHTKFGRGKTFFELHTKRRQADP